MGLPLRLGLETLGWGGAALALGGKSPPGRRPPMQMGSRPAPPLPGGLYKGGREGSTTTAFGASLLPCNTSLSLAEARRSPAVDPLHPPPRRRVVGSPSTSPSPLLDQEGGDVIRSVRVLNAKVMSVQHLVIGDLDHGEYDSVIHVHWNASARDLQGYVDTLLSLRC